MDAALKAKWVDINSRLETLDVFKQLQAADDPEIGRPLAQLCELFVDGAPDQRREVLALINQLPAVRMALFETVPDRSTPGPRWVELRVAALLLHQDSFDDREVIMAMGSVYLRGMELDVDPGPVFKRITQLARDAGMARVANWGDFESWAYFAESIAPRLKGGRNGK